MTSPSVVDAETCRTPDGNGTVTMTVFDDNTAVYAFHHPELPARCDVVLRRRSDHPQYTLDDMRQVLGSTFNAALADGSHISEAGDTGTTRMKMKPLPGGWSLVTRVQHGPPRWVWPKLSVGRDRSVDAPESRTWFLMAGWQFTAVQVWLTNRSRAGRS